MNTKKCLQCGIEFEKPYNCSKKSWVSVKFCSKKCKYKSPIVREKISLSQKGKPREYLIGHEVSEETRKKIGNGRRGKKHTAETKKIIGEKGKGRPAWNIGIKCPWTSERNRVMNKERVREKHPNWKGGKSFGLYGFDFTKELKTLIRKRDKFTCQICGKNGYDVHHIDYNKKNCNQDNLITLCRSCHTKTNWNREKWLDYFKSRFLTLS